MRLGIIAVLAMAIAWPASAPAAKERRAAAVRAKTNVPTPQLGAEEAARQDSTKIVRTEAEWKKLLTPEQFRILRGADTELACSGKYWKEHRRGIYRCVACGYILFSSDGKFESGTGWPSFWAPLVPSHLEVVTDTSHGMVRDEVRCARCGSHLGHVFDDGPKPTGRRYCMNSVALDFVEVKK